MYNSRRSTSFVNQPPASAVGQRRPPAVSNNFVPGGQLNLNNQGNYRRQQPNFNIQQQRGPQGNQHQFQLQRPLVQQQTAPIPQQQQPKLLQQSRQQQPPPLQQLQQPVPPPEQLFTPKIENINITQPLDESMSEDVSESSEGTEKKPRPFWLKNAGKISRKEKIRRRNKRLVRFLQPKNAVMVLNEMIGNSTYTLSENADEISGLQFKASVLVDGVEHYGYGKSKMGAKASAAETAIKYLVLKKLKSVGQTTHSIVGKIESGEDVDMEEGTEDVTLPWQHVASFALHKLFSNWDEGGTITDRLVSTATTTDGTAPVLSEKKPAKKMPPNPETMNPIMLLNQMVPHAQYVELSKAGNPPSVVFTYKCSANGQSFIGRGGNKKQAKKMCAFEACRTLLNVEYPPEVFAQRPHSNSNQSETMALA